MRRFVISILLCLPAWAADADLILHNGKIVTVDAAFHVVEAIAAKGGRITATGTSADILKRSAARGPRWSTSAARRCSPA